MEVWKNGSMEVELFSCLWVISYEKWSDFLFNYFFK